MYYSLYKLQIQSYLCVNIIIDYRSQHEKAFEMLYSRCTTRHIKDQAEHTTWTMVGIFVGIFSQPFRIWDLSGVTDSNWVENVKLMDKRSMSWQDQQCNNKTQRSMRFKYDDELQTWDLKRCWQTDSLFEMVSNQKFPSFNCQHGALALQWG